MTYTLVSYGAGEVLEATFNAIAALLNSKTGSLYNPLVRFALLIGLGWATATMVYGDQARFIKKWVVPLFLILTLFFAPTCMVHIHDPVTGHHYSVDNVPWGLGAVAGIISQTGDKITKEIEKTFSLPDDLKYHKTGAVMASHLIANARTFHITNTDLADTMRSFVNQCVIYDALIGRKYTIHDLKNTSDIWKLVSENPSPARSFTYKPPGKGQQAQIVTCARGVSLLDGLLKQDMKNAFHLFESKILKRYPPPNRSERAKAMTGMQLKQYLPLAFDYMTHLSKSAEDYMMQQMMIYAVVDSIETKSTALGNAPNFAVRKAYLQQRAHQETVAGIAAQKLIAMKNVMEALIYVAFIFILPMALVPSGWQFISRWIGLVMWIQLWAPLYAVLNFIMNISIRAKGIGMLSSADGSGVTIANSIGFMNLHADMAAQAGFMSLAVGSLSYALVKGGAASLAHLVSNVSGPASSAAASATESLMSGNYSFGNVSQGTVQAYNQTFGQQNHSPSYASGSFNQNDGVINRTTSTDGNHIINVANSNLRSSLNFSESLSNSYSEQASKAQQMAENKMIAAAQAEADHNRNVIDFSSHRAQQISDSDSFSTGETASTNQAFTKLDSLVNRFAQDHNVSKEIASQMIASASAKVETGVGFKLFGNGASANFSMGATRQFTGSEFEKDLFSKAQDYTKQSNFQEALNQASQAARDTRYSELSDEGKRLTSGINASYEQSSQYRNEANASLQKSESFSQMASWTKQNAGSINASLNQEYVNWLQAQSLPNSSGSMGIREAETIVASRPELDQQYQQRFMAQKLNQVEDYQSSNGLPSSSADVRTSFDQAANTIKNSTSSNSLDYETRHAENQGLGDEFKINTQPRADVNAKLSSLKDQIFEQKELLEKEAAIRKAEIKKNERL